MAKENKDARDVIDTDNTNNELTTIGVKSLSNIEEKVEALDWKLWEIYNMIKSYVEKLDNQELSAPNVERPGVSAKDVADELLSALNGTTPAEDKKKASVVSKLFGSK